MKRITVFAVQVQDRCYFLTQATELGQTLAKKNIELVYGGANVGLMEL
jgi:predicted Rossmann-fold nucleotide-binding protein